MILTTTQAIAIFNIITTNVVPSDGHLMFNIGDVDSEIEIFVCRSKIFVDKFMVKSKNRDDDKHEKFNNFEEFAEKYNLTWFVFESHNTTNGHQNEILNYLPFEFSDYPNFVDGFSKNSIMG